MLSRCAQASQLGLSLDLWPVKSPCLEYLPCKAFSMADSAAFAASESVGSWESAAAALEAEETRDVALAIGVESEDGITIWVCDEFGGEGLEIVGETDEPSVESDGVDE